MAVGYIQAIYYLGKKGIVRRFRRIAILLGTDLGYCRGVVRGIQRYQPRSARWVFHDAAPDIAVLGALAEWQPHGVIALLFQRELAEGLSRLRVPVVNVTYTWPDLKFPLVDVDHLQVGDLAARHFLDRGFRHFGFFGSPTAGFSRDRCRGFQRTLQAAGCDCSACAADFWPRLAASDSWTAIDKRVLRWVKSLPKPAGVLASNDIPARELAEVCRTAGLRVPEDVAILGVDNDELECSLTYPPLSSVILPTEQIGHEAASMLDRQLQGKAVSPRQKLLPPVGVATRQSTDVLAIDDPEIAAAVRYIHQHAWQGISVTDVLRVVPIARRSLEMRFRQILGRSPREEILRLQIGRAKQLLISEQLSVSEVAAQAGFGSSQGLAIVFRRETGQTCSDYRRQFRGLGSAVLRT